MKDGLTIVGCLLLAVYCAFSYGSPPEFIGTALSPPLGKFVAYAAAIAACILLNPLLGIMLALAVTISLPGIEFFVSKVRPDGPKETTSKPPGKSIQPRRAPSVDTESHLIHPKLSTTVDHKQIIQAAKRAAGRKVLPANA